LNFRAYYLTKRPTTSRNFNISSKIFSQEPFAFREDCLGFIVTFRICAGLRTENREDAGNFGEEIFSFAIQEDLYANYLM